MYLALGIATVIYVAVALGVFGTLTVDEVIASGGTALAVAAEPMLGRAGYWLMTRHRAVRDRWCDERRALPGGRACARRWPSGPVPAAAGPPVRRARPGRASLVTAAIAIVLAVGFDLSSIASIGSAIALLVFTLVTAATSGCAARRARARWC